MWQREWKAKDVEKDFPLAQVKVEKEEVWLFSVRALSTFSYVLSPLLPKKHVPQTAPSCLPVYYYQSTFTETLLTPTSNNGRLVVPGKRWAQSTVVKRVLQGRVLNSTRQAFFSSSNKGGNKRM